MLAETRDWLERGNFGDPVYYHGELELGDTWALAMTTHRNDDTLGRSNWTAMLGLLGDAATDPDDAEPVYMTD